MVLPELRALAKEIGVKGASGMRKSELIAAIRERRGESNGRTRRSRERRPTTPPAGDSAGRQQAPRRPTSGGRAAPGTARAAERAAAGRPRSAGERRRQPRRQSRRRGEAEQAGPARRTTKAGRRPRSDKADDRPGRQTADRATKAEQGRQRRQQRPQQRRPQQDGGQQAAAAEPAAATATRNNNATTTTTTATAARAGAVAGSVTASARERGGEGGGGGGGGDRDTELREDDVVQPVAGILDVLDNYAFVRTSGYLAGPNDVYVSMNMVRKNGLRRGDAVTGAVRVPAKEGGGGGHNPRQKFNPLVRLDTVNGGPVEDARKRARLQQADPAVPEPAAAPGDHAGSAHHPRHRPDHADR